MFFEEISRRHPGSLEIFKKIYEFSKSTFDDIWWGTGNRTGSFIPFLPLGKTGFLQFFGVYTSGSVEIQFQHLKNKEPFIEPEKRLAILQEINSIFH